MLFCNSIMTIGNPSDFYNKHAAKCKLCPRRCGVRRNNTALTAYTQLKAFCGESADIRIAFAGLHFGEEPCLCSSGGSGTIFFTGCSLKCPFCQNMQISRHGFGRTVQTEEFADILLKLQKAGADNINFVTGTHFVPAILFSLELARKKGLIIPVVWNTSGYEEPATIKLLNKYIDIYLTDIKTLDSDLSLKVFKTDNYPRAVKSTLPLMVKGRGPEYKNDSLVKGVIVRHLVLPGELESTKKVIKWFKENIGGRALLCVMFQYTPVKENKTNPGLNNLITQKEYEQVVLWLDEYGIEDGFVQELSTDSSWYPDFTKEYPFSSELCRKVWHYNE